jgi:hypothetical protein
MAKAPRLTLKDFSDLELLRRLEDVADDEGYATVTQIARKLNLSHPHPERCVISRFSWLRRFGILEKDEERGWKLTKEADLAINASFTRTAERELGKLGEGQYVALMDLMSQSYRSVTPGTANLMRRQWQFGLSRNGKK